MQLTSQFLSQWHGLQTYAVGLSEMERAWQATLLDGQMRILAFEFQPVITIGRRGTIARDLLGPVPAGYHLYSVYRGGEATLHNPGQLVIYPICPLRHWQWRVRDFVKLLQQVTARCLAQYAVDVRCGQEPGLYLTNGAKMAFFGLGVKGGVSLHGLSINVHNQLNDFQLIRSCGIEHPTLSKLSEFRERVTCESVFKVWLNCWLVEQDSRATSSHHHPQPLHSGGSSLRVEHTQPPLAGSFCQNVQHQKFPLQNADVAL